jgi:glycosyltransferase involved in cell wall biosynthesis
MTTSLRPRFTIFTPTYNRAHTLPRTYASLTQQTLLPHEWIVVDDGSTDGTAELVRGWTAEARFPIRYIHQENAGKPAAHNAGVAAATGDLLAVLDADDWILPHALERLAALWQEIPAADRDQFTGITVNCQYENGQLIGEPFPSSPIDSTILDLWSRGWLRGEKWGFHRVEVAQQYPFPTFPGEKYVPEGLVWHRIGRHYRMRFVNETLEVKDFQDDGITRNWLRTMTSSPRSARLFYVELARHSASRKVRTFGLINAARFGAHASGPRPDWEVLRTSPVLAPVVALGAWVLWAFDSVRLRRAANGDAR